MAHNPRRRFWLEVALASLTGILFLVTLISRDWIESVFGVDPDAHSGSLEWALVAALLVVTITLGVVARTEWRRAAAATTGGR
jgi:hypothetical protein